MKTDQTTRPHSNKQLQQARVPSKKTVFTGYCSRVCHAGRCRAPGSCLRLVHRLAAVAVLLRVALVARKLHRLDSKGTCTGQNNAADRWAMRQNGERSAVCFWKFNAAFP